MKKKAKKTVYLLSLILSAPIHCFLLFLEKARWRPLAYKLSALVVNFFGSDILAVRRDYDVIEKKQVDRAILAVPSFGCVHYFKRGGCAMCGFNKEIEKYGLRNLHPLAIILLVHIFLIFLANKIKKERLSVDILAIFMAGSFLNEEELPLKAQNIIVDFFSKSNIKKIFIESRPEFVIKNKGRLESYIKKIAGKRMEIAIGLEAVDDKIRNGLIKKNITLRQYQQAIKTVNSINAIATTYVLVGAPFLNESEIIKSAVESAIFAWQSGSDMVNIEAYCVQEGTPWAELYKKGLLKLPSLWGIIEVIKKINEVSSAWYLGEFSDWPKPIAVPSNCEKCTDEVMGVLDQLRATCDVTVLYNLPKCSCRNSKFSF